MKLSSITEGHWVLAPQKYPGSILPKAKRAERHSIFVNPKDRDKFAKKMGIKKNNSAR